MAYRKQTFIDYPNDGCTILRAEHLNHIEDGIANSAEKKAMPPIQQTTNLLKDSDLFWRADWVQSVDGSLQSFTEDTLSVIEGNGWQDSAGNSTRNYISSPLIKMDSSIDTILRIRLNSLYFRQMRIFNAKGDILFTAGDNDQRYSFPTGISKYILTTFFNDDENKTAYPKLYESLETDGILFNADTLTDLNALFRKEQNSTNTYIKREPIYLTFNLMTGTSRPGSYENPPTDTELSVWVAEEANRCSLSQTKSTDIYRLPELSLSSSTARKYYTSPIFEDILTEMGEFKNLINVTDTDVKTYRSSTVYSDAMIDDFYPNTYLDKYISGAFSILDVNTPTYDGATTFEGYKISRPMPIDLSSSNNSYTSKTFIRHLALCQKDGSLICWYENVNSLNITSEYIEVSSNSGNYKKYFIEDFAIDSNQVGYLCVSNRDAALTNFKLTEERVAKEISYKLPGLVLTSEQSAGGGGEGTGASNTVDLWNVDRIVAIGDSYTESHYTIKDKAWISKVSLLSDYNYDNFAISGDTYRGQLNKIRTGNYSYAPMSGMTWEKLHPTHALLISKTNDTKYMNCQQFMYDMVATIETTKGLGAIPIIATEYHVSDQDYTQTAFDYYAKKYGGYYIDLTEKDYTLRGTDYAPFWGGSHPGTRTNHIFSDVITNYINKNLPRPYSAIKIFRPRDTSLVTNLDNYLFGNIEERAEKFKEISICHSALNNPALYDNCTEKSNSKVESEYFKLMAGAAVEFDKVCLIDVILPTTVHDISKVELVTNTMDGVNCYVKDILAQPYPSPAFCRRFDIAAILDSTQVAIGNTYTSDKSTGTTYKVEEIKYEKVESSTGFVDGTILICSGNMTTGAYNNSTLTLTSGTGASTLPCTYEAVGLLSDYPSGKQDIGHYIPLTKYGVVEGSTLKRAVDYDKITFLLVSDSTFNLRNVEIKFKGNITKTRNTPTYNNTLPSSYYNTSTSLVTHPTFDTNNISYWLKNNQSACGLTPEVPVDKVLPTNISSIVTLKPTDGTILQSFTTTSNAGCTYNMNHKVKVWARYFPDIFDSTTMSYPEDAAITDNSFDWAKLNIQLYDSVSSARSNATVKMPKLVGLHWTEVELDITLPPINKTWYIGLSVEDKPIQLAKCIIE